MISLQEAESSLESVHHVPVPFGMSRIEINSAIADFVDFISLPQEQLKRFEAVRLDPEDRGSYVGYRRRNPEDGKSDDKIYFHYHTLFESLFADAIKETGDVAERFVSSARTVCTEARKSLASVVDLFEPKYPELRERFLSPNSHYFLRFLAYLRSGKELAKGHYDRGGATLAIAESVPGLRMGKNEGDLVEVIHEEGKALFFGGYELRDRFSPTWHDVVDKGGDYDEQITRWAIVFFADKQLKKGASHETLHSRDSY